MKYTPEKSLEAANLRSMFLTGIVILVLLFLAIQLLHLNDIASVVVYGFTIQLFLLYSLWIWREYKKTTIHSDQPIINGPIESNGFFSCVNDKDVTTKLLINNTQFQRAQIEFTSLDGIKSQKVGENEMLIFTKDYRTIKLHKDEIKNFYLSLIESDYSYFKPGVHQIELMIKTKDK